MKRVYFKSGWTLYLCGKIRKNYKVNDILKLKSMICKLKVIEVKTDEIYVIPA
jgi:hypothetical protein